MHESEATIQRGATQDDTLAGRVCRQVVDDPVRYAVWHGWHDSKMSKVARDVERDRQIIALRAVYLEQVHRTALVRYLRKHRLTGAVRDVTLSEFHGLADPRRAAIFEHRAFLISASSQLCANRILKLIGDRRGLELMQEYQRTYTQYFGMFCEDARASRQGSEYLLRGLIPEAKAEADALRARILGGEALPPRPVAMKYHTGQTGRYRRIDPRLCDP